MSYIYDTSGERQEAVSALMKFPYFILEKDIDTSDYRTDLIQIKKAYIMYKKGVRFNPEGTGGDYVPSMIRFKNIKYLINKEARFMFSHAPDINVVEQNEADKQTAEEYAKVLKKMLEESKFPGKILKASKDCLIGKRVACMVDITEEGQLMLHFYDALHFYYEYNKESGELEKFICFEVLKVRKRAVGNSNDYLIYKYTKENGKVYCEGSIYDGRGVVKEQIVALTETQLEDIPAVIIFNDGLLDEEDGVSEIEDLEEFERGYTSLANSDIDSMRKGMNPIKYLVDMNHRTTQGLTTSPGSLWDMESNQDMDNPKPQVGQLAPELNHSEPLKQTLNRLKMSMHEALDVPNINEETLSGTITSGKALKALYYPLTVRCDEKMISWSDAIKDIIRKAFDLALLNEGIVKEYYVLSNFKEMQYDIDVQVNYALLDDVMEEMEQDLNEIAQNARSRKSYLTKWRSDDIINDKQAEDELMQIATEVNMFDTTSINMSVQDELDKQTGDEKTNEGVEIEEAEDSIKSKVKVGEEIVEGDESGVKEPDKGNV